jgi:phosphonate transport system substrate-binding protein
MDNDMVSRRRSLFFSSLIAVLLLSIGYAAAELPTDTTSAPKSSQDRPGPLVFGVFPRRSSTDTVRLFTPMAEMLAKELGRDVHLETTPDFQEFWRAIGQRRYDLAHFNQYHYVRSHKEYGYRVIVKNEEFGSDAIAGSIFVRKDSGLNSLQDLRGKKIIFGGGPTAMQSYIIPTYLLANAGLNEGDYKKHYAISPPNALYAVYFGHADAGCSGNTVASLPVVTQNIDTSELKELVRSKDGPQLPWAVRDDMSPELEKKIQSILVGLKDTQEGRYILAKASITGLTVATDEQFDEHRKIIFQVLDENYCKRNCDSY